eukprot:271561_1
MVQIDYTVVLFMFITALLASVIGGLITLKFISSNNHMGQSKSNKTGPHSQQIPHSSQSILQPTQHFLTSKESTKYVRAIRKSTYDSVECFTSASFNCQCKCIKRILEGLKFYQSLNVMDKYSQQKIVIYFEQQYQWLLDDYIHIVTNHGSHVDQIHDVMFADFNLSSCNFKTCSFSQRHHR